MYHMLLVHEELYWKGELCYNHQVLLRVCIVQQGMKGEFNPTSILSTIEIQP